MSAERLVAAGNASRGIWYDLERLRFERVDSPKFADVQGIPSPKRRGDAA